MAEPSPFDLRTRTVATSLRAADKPPERQADYAAAIARLATLGMPPTVVALCQAMSKQGLALEHEAVWL